MYFRGSVKGWIGMMFIWVRVIDKFLETEVGYSGGAYRVFRASCGFRRDAAEH